MPKVRTASTRKQFPFLLGHSESSITSYGKLPLTINILRYFMYRRSLPMFKLSSPSAVICCPLRTGTREAKCLEPGGCYTDEGVKCVVAKMKTEGYWLESGLPITSDQTITNKVLKILDTQRAVTKHKNITSCSAELKRNNFKTVLNSLFDISKPNCLDIINQDRLRSEEAKIEDIDIMISLFLIRSPEIIEGRGALSRLLMLMLKNLLVMKMK